MARFFAWFATILLVLIIVAGGFIWWLQFENQPPVIKPLHVPNALGIESVIKVEVSDNRSGLRSIRAEVEQDGRVVTLPGKEYKLPPFYERKGVLHDTVTIEIRPVEQGLKDGEAEEKIVAADASWRNGLQGNMSAVEIKIPVDITPPRIAIKSTVHNIRMGGAGLVSFGINEKPSKVGIRLGNVLFPAYAFSKQGSHSYIALVALPHDKKNPGPMLIEVEDLAGNKSKASVAYSVLYRRSKVDRINISDSFLQRKMPDLAIHYPEVKGSLLEQFLIINNKIRKENNQQLLSLCRNGTPEILWHGSFVRMPGSLRARFADFRHYFYKGKEIDQAYHMGVDIADRTHSPVPAGNRGKVVFAGFLGIYGNTVVLDHGIGLFSTYSHLSQINVNRGDMVERGQTIGLTGLTGLAGGDHLHYGMAVNGIFVNPVEWWDMKWIRDHILANLI